MNTIGANFRDDKGRFREAPPKSETAMRIVNAIPAVIAAPAGICTTIDLPLITGKGLYAAG